MAVTPAALAALCDDKRLLIGQIRNDSARICLLDDRTDRHFYNCILPLFACTACPAAILTVLRLIFAFIFKIRQSGQIRVGDKYNISASAAVAAVRTAVCNIFFTVKCGGTVASVARLYRNSRSIYKHSFTFPEYSPFLLKIHYNLKNGSDKYMSEPLDGHNYLSA